MIDFTIWFLAILAGVIIVVMVVFFGGMTIASICDWNYRRKYGAWIALQDDYKPKRPIAK